MKAIQFKPVKKLWLPAFLLLSVVISQAPAGGRSDAPAGDSDADLVNATARVEYLEGDVRADGELLNIGDALFPGIQIITGPNGIIEITFGQGNILRVEEDTSLSLNLADPTEGLDIQRGSVAAVFEGLQTIGVGPARSLNVRTPVAVAGVRGTVFYIKVESQDSTYVCTCHGELVFEDGKYTVRSARHNANRFFREDDRVRFEEAEELYHDSASLDAVAETAGVNIRWGEEPNL
ncbi:FecR family protein [Spirochaeta dissipatitropha]